MHFRLHNSGLHPKIVDQPLFFGFQKTYATDWSPKTESQEVFKLAK